MKINKCYTVLFSTLFILTSNICFAFNSRHNKGLSLTNISLSIVFLLIIVSVPLYFLVYLPYIKRKKIKEFCDKNNLKFTAESKKLPDNISLKFINFNAGKNGDCTFKNIMQGTKNDISFIMCEFSFKYTEGCTKVYSPSFPLFILKRPNISFPYFLLRRRNDITGFQKILSVSMSGGYEMKTRKAEELLMQKYKNMICYYQNILLNLQEDQQFNKKFDIDVDNEQEAKQYIDDNVRRFFAEKSKPQFIYEGNGDLFTISSSKSFSTFEDMIMFFQDQLKFYMELTSI